MQEVPPAKNDETGLCDKCEARNRNTPIASAVQDVMATTRATVFCWAKGFLSAGGGETMHWRDVFELEAAFPNGGKGGDEGCDDGLGSDTMSYNTAEMDMPPVPQSPPEDRPVFYENRKSPKPLPVPKQRSANHEKHTLDKLRYLEEVVVEPKPMQDGGDTFSGESKATSNSRREICVELDGWYVVAACLGISVEELHEMMTRILEKHTTGSEEVFDEE
jgi:hypothetical protein